MPRLQSLPLRCGLLCLCLLLWAPLTVRAQDPTLLFVIVAYSRLPIASCGFPTDHQPGRCRQASVGEQGLLAARGRDSGLRSRNPDRRIQRHARPDQRRDADLQQEIGERKRAESSLQGTYTELKETNEHLQQEINERRRAEEARRLAEAELEAQRTLSLRSDRLRSLGEMAAGIAHELNQPLTGVRGLAELTLIEQDQNWELSREELRERLGQIIEQADRMVHIIDRVRTFARGAGNPETSLVQVNDVVRSGIELLGVQFSTRKLELKMELAEDLPLVRANPYSLEEVVINLLSNARDATEAHRDEEGAARRPGVLIRTGSNGVDNDSRVQIQIIDSGVGIPADIVPKVFDPFFTTKGPKKGTGLGLAISLSIVEQFGGDLQVESMPGTGTTMTISLPVAQEPHGD